MSTATNADSGNSTGHEPGEEICPGCREVTEAINGALGEHSNQRLWLKVLAEAIEKLDQPSSELIGRARFERDNTIEHLCARMTRIARSDLTAEE